MKPKTKKSKHQKPAGVLSVEAPQGSLSIAEHAKEAIVKHVGAQKPAESKYAKAAGVHSEAPKKVPEEHSDGGCSHPKGVYRGHNVYVCLLCTRRITWDFRTYRWSRRERMRQAHVFRLQPHTKHALRAFHVENAR